MSIHIGPPKFFSTLREFPQLGAEILFSPFNRKILDQAPRGSGIILVLPGFLAHDYTTVSLRNFLKKQGHTVYAWENGFNTGPSKQVSEYLSELLHKISEDHNGARIILVGHSLGGIYARELARAFPNLVDRVITLGTPFAAGRHPTATMIGLRKIFIGLHGMDHLFLQPEYAHHFLHHPPAPTTSLYTTQDGVVHWQTCIGHAGLLKEHIEIPRTSHCGLLVNPLALLAVADRAAAKIEIVGGKINWPRFNPVDYPLAAYPEQQAHEALIIQEPAPSHQPPLFFSRRAPTLANQLATALDLLGIAFNQSRPANRHETPHSDKLTP